MKHLLNNMSEEEKNSIREQHTGGMKLNTQKFISLLESKLGDVKPLTEQKISQTGSTQNQKIKGVGMYSGDLRGKTFNFYLDKDNRNFLMTGTIKSLEKMLAGIHLKAEFLIGGRNKGGVSDFFFDCETKEFRPMSGDSQIGYWSKSLADELTKRFCDVSPAGTEVPSADFVQP